jgi:PAS domain S-box-containing protein
VFGSPSFQVRAFALPAARWQRCCLGVAVFLAATALRLALQPVLGEQAPFLVHIVAVAAASWFGGVEGGFCAAVLSSAAVDYLFVAPRYTFKPGAVDHAGGMALFVIVSFGLVWQVGRWRLAEQALRENAERLRLHASLMDYAHDAIFVRDRDERIAFWNRGAEELYGWTADEALGRNAQELLGTEPEAARGFTSQLAQRGAWQGELAHVRRDRSRVVVDSRHLRVDRANGPSVVLEINRDITDQKRASEDRERLYREAEEANRVKDEFLATLSHELRTPLNAILGWSQMLASGGLGADAERQAVEVILRNANAQVRLVEEVLDLSRIASGRLRLERQVMDVRPVIERALDTTRPAAEAKQLTVTALLPDAVTMVGDPDRLQQVMWNLVSNAVKFTPKGGRVSVTARRVDSHAEIRVSDTGIGIASEFLPRLFERFTQADGSRTRRHGGLGLGLAIVRHIVELHGGTVEASSPGEGQGAVFTVRLPIAAVQPDRAVDGVEAETAATADKPLAGVKVLAVDDDYDSLQILGAILTRAGASVTTSGSADAGMEALLAFRPDILVCDIGMPGEDGHSFVRRVRALPAGAGGRVPALALTAYGHAKDRRDALAAGFDEHLAKPIRRHELVSVLSRMVRGGRPAGAPTT